MRKILTIASAIMLLANTASATDYECNIEQYGSPVNFAGSFQRQKELLRSWMPASTFYLYVNGQDVILHHSGGDNGRTPAAAQSLNGNTATYQFDDTPMSSANQSRIRRNTMTFDQSDLGFSMVLTMGNGPRTKRSGGSAYGQCGQLR